MLLELGSNLYHTAVLFIVIYGITRFFGILGRVAESTQKKMMVKNEPIKFTK